MNVSKMCLSAAEVSEQTGISISLVRKMTRGGKIPHIRVGRRIVYPVTAIHDWLLTNTIGNTPPEKDGEIDG